MKTADILAMIALVISVGTAVYATQVSKHVSSSDYMSSERVKSETARLLATLRSMATKGFYAAVFKEEADLTYERQSINEFINSTSAFAYYAWVRLKSDETAEGTPEKWRLLFPHLSLLTRSDDPQSYVRLAVEVERMFNSLGQDDLKVIVGLNSNFIEGIAKSKVGRDPLLEAIHHILQVEEVQRGADPKLAIRQLTFLKHERGIDDPDLDLALALLQQDAQGLVEALGPGGADMSGSITGVLKRYEHELEDFKEGSEER